MELEKTRDLLLQAMDQQLADNQKAVDTNRILADQKTAYENEARGTYYSGMPTWQRAQNAVEAAEKLQDVNKNYASNKIKIWDSVQDALDKIQAYNEAASMMVAPVAGLSSAGQTSNTPFIMNGKYYQFVNGQLKEVR